LEAIGQGGEPEGGVICFRGFAVLSEPLRHVAWPPRFRPEASAHFDGSPDPVEFLQCYAITIRVIGGDGRVMANWFPMATMECLIAGSGSCPRNPSRLGEVSACASSKSLLPWALSPRTRMTSWLLAVPPLEHKKLRLGAWGHRRLAFS
jgi:hypothetical protein